MVGAKYWNIGGIIGVSPVPQAFKLVTVEGHVHFICPRIDDLKISLKGRAFTVRADSSLDPRMRKQMSLQKDLWKYSW